MSSVTVGQTDWPPMEFARRRRAQADRDGRTVAAQDQPQSECNELLAQIVGIPLPVERSTELGIIRSLLDDVADGGAAMVLSGAQGTGKTTLLDAAQRAASAKGIRVVRVNGAEFEAGIGLAGLHQLIVPLSEELSELPHRMRRAIEEGLDFGIGRSPDRLVFLNAVFALLRRAARSRPTVLIVDDVQWFDPASAEVLAFVARRLAGSRVGLLAAMRAGSGSLLQQVGLPEMRLPPLTNTAAATDGRRILTLTARDNGAVADGREPLSVNDSAPLTIAPWPSMDRHRPDPVLRAASAKGAELLHRDGEVDAALDVLVGAIVGSWRRPGPDIAGLVQALGTLTDACYFGARSELWVQFHRILDLLGDMVPPVLRLVARICADPVAASTADLREVDQLVTLLQASGRDPAQTVQIGMAAHLLDRLPGCRSALREIYRGAGDRGAGDDAVRAGLLLAFDAVDAGRWAEAETLAQECLALCETGGRGLFAWSARSVVALLAAGRGQWEVCQTLTNEMEAWATPRGVHSLIQDAHQVRRLAALGRGDHDGALSDARAMARRGAVRTDEIRFLRGSLDRVEAAVRMRGHADASAHATAMAVADIVRLSPRFALQAAGAKALVAPDPLAADLFRAALEIPGIGRWPFDVARLQLAFGERLRRLQTTRASREQLAAAFDTFTRLGARPWAERAGAELRATGRTRNRAEGKCPTTLTPQEIEIAELAATGLTNKEIGARMYLSPRTVSAHLYRVFPKLGITSRAALRDALSALPALR